MTYESVNPFNGKHMKSFADITDAHLETALAAAATCFETWRHKTVKSRPTATPFSRPMLTPFGHGIWAYPCSA
jgi:hypothetical protein